MEPVRPTPDRLIGQRIREWWEWFGLARLVTAAGSVIVVAAGSWWLLHAPPPPVEQSLPFTSRAPSGHTSVDLPAGSAAPVSAASVAALTTSTMALVPEVVVQIAGEVFVPGVYRLAAGSRVDDLVRAAGGATPTGDPHAINLAIVLRDGDRVRVPAHGEVTEAPIVATNAASGLPSATSPVGGRSPGSPGNPSGAPIDLNRATADELDALPGVGPATAAAIVAHRDTAGPFASIDDLLGVRGIGPAKLDGLRGLVAV